MTTVQFKKTSGSTAYSFDAISVEPDFEIENTQYSDINYTFRDVIDASWKKWNIKFGHISETNQDYLLELKKEAAPQMILDSVTYGVRFIDFNIKAIGGSLTAINRIKES